MKKATNQTTADGQQHNSKGATSAATSAQVYSNSQAGNGGRSSAQINAGTNTSEHSQQWNKLSQHDAKPKGRIGGYELHPSDSLPRITRGALVTDFEKDLFSILSVQRNHGSLGEAEVFSWLVAQCVHLGKRVMVDGAGNLHVDLRNGSEHRTMFTSHSDTCHSNRGNEVNPIHLDIDDATGNTIWRAGYGVCLGADDGAGVALMLRMITHGVPAYYVFFRGEERGGIGSSWLAENMPDLLRQFDRAIAFDRAGYSDVITHQAGGRCCSDKFAQALSDALTTEDFSLAYAPDDGGVYTDTAEFIDIIPECTNVAVFYARQHGDMEYLDVTALHLLAQRLLTVQWEALPTKRDVTVDDSFASRWASVTRTRATNSKMYDLIQDAIDFGDVGILIEHIACIVDSEQPEYAKARMDPDALDEATLEYSLVALESGALPDDVAFDLYSIAWAGKE